MTIGLNYAALNHSSYENLTATIYPEIIHAHLRSMNIPGSQHHNEIATILKNSGITLLKAEANSNIFKKIGTEEEKNPDGTPKKDSNGNKIYKNADCP